MRGGPRYGSGRPPDPNALRRARTDDHVQFVTLPVDGRQGEPLPWPLPTPMDDAERVVWSELWRLPQATEWERLQQQRTVALYVRSLVEADARDAAVALRTLVRQLEDSLGLTPTGMRANRWILGSAPRPDDDGTNATGEGDGTVISARDRFRGA